MAAMCPYLCSWPINLQVVIGSSQCSICPECLHEMHIWYAQPAFVQVAQALAVSMNKLGDQRYLSGDLQGAKQHYTEALTTRQGSCCPSEPASVETQLGVVTSLLKVLDIEQVGTCLIHAGKWRLEQWAARVAMPVDGKQTDVHARLTPSMLGQWLNVQALGEDSAAAQHKQEAGKVLRELTAAVPPEGPVRAKYMGLQAFMQQVR